MRVKKSKWKKGGIEECEKDGDEVRKTRGDGYS